MKKHLTFAQALEHRNAHFVLKRFGLMDDDNNILDANIAKLDAYRKELYAFGIEMWNPAHEFGGEICATLWQLIVPVGRIWKGQFAGKNNKRTFFDRTRKDSMLKNGILEYKDGSKSYGMIELEEFLKMNDNHQDGGHYYEYHEEETVIANKILAENIEARKKAAEEKEIAGAAFIHGVGALATSRQAKVAVKETTSKPTKRPWVVTIEMEAMEYNGPDDTFDENDYLTVGTKAHCNKYLSTEKAKEKKLKK